MNESTQKNELLLKTITRFSGDERLNSLLTTVVDEVTSYADELLNRINRLSEIGRSLSGEYNLNALLERIMDHARQFTNADAGTLYILEDSLLKFKIVQNDALNIRMGGTSGEAIPFAPVELRETNVSAFVALNGIPVNIPDVYNTNLFDFTGPKKFDSSTGYRSKSMLVVPMRNHENDIIGVLQLLNAKNPRTGEVISFSPDFENLTSALASQAAIAITTAKLINDMDKLFESFVKVMATAIDEKSPVTGGHIRRVANLTMVMAQVINDQNAGIFKDIHFAPDKLHELKIAAWMHDIGKVTTPVEVIEKAKKLQTIFDRIQYVDVRMQYLITMTRNLALQEKIRLLEKGAAKEEIDEAEKKGLLKENELLEIRKFFHHCNQPGEFLDDAVLNKLKELSALTYVDIDGNTKPYLEPDELVNLSIRKGSITEEERKIMQNHASVTLRMLEQIPFTKRLKNIPHFAGAHHEFINGKGYPLGLKGDQIPIEGRLMAITDIAEALTASDRPYKKAMPLENVYRILKSMAEKGELDNSMVELFINEKVYERYKTLHEP
jgi:HD-GYP domain-containing protein (c-di-GMP phosphodiesterase class II)